LVLRKILREIKYYLWALNGLVGLRFRSNAPQKATILFTYYNPVRMKHINHQLRNIFKCDFVGQVIISNHNPDFDITSLITVRDARIKVVNQNVPRGCGHRWLVANEFSPEYLIVVDDDVLIFPWQLRQLFEALVAEPEIPHGFAGMVQHEGGFLEYRQEEERSLDYICEIYALTGAHLKRFMELRNEIVKDESLGHMVESAADFMVVSRSGSRAPMIHDAGRLFRCPTYNEAGVAVHKDSDFNNSMMGVARALDALASNHPTADPVPVGGTHGSN
jgi:hypothetical protein